MKLIANNIHKNIKGKTILNDISLEMETGNIYMDFGVEMDLEKPCCFGHYRV